MYYYHYYYYNLKRTVLKYREGGRESQSCSQLQTTQRERLSTACVSLLSFSPSTVQLQIVKPLPPSLKTYLSFSPKPSVNSDLSYNGQDLDHHVHNYSSAFSLTSDSYSKETIKPPQPPHQDPE